MERNFETVSLIEASRFLVLSMGDGLRDFEWCAGTGAGDVAGIDGMSLVERFLGCSVLFSSRCILKLGSRSFRLLTLCFLPRIK